MQIFDLRMVFIVVRRLIDNMHRSMQEIQSAYNAVFWNHLSNLIQTYFEPR